MAKVPAEVRAYLATIGARGGKRASGAGGRAEAMKRVHGSHGLESSAAERHCARPPAGLQDMDTSKAVRVRPAPPARRPLRRVPGVGSQPVPVALVGERSIVS